METVFSKIIDGKISCEKVFENDLVLAIKDIAPQAPVHLLIIPKKPIENIASMQEEDFPILMEIVRVAKKLAKQFDLQEGYRLVTNSGPDAGQEVYHLHFHLLGGKKLSRLG